MTTIEIAPETIRANVCVPANDLVLLPLLDTDEPERSEALERILLSEAVPVVDAVLRRKSNRLGTRRRFSAEDEEDIRAGAIYRITRRIMADLATHPIARFADYCAAVTLHACDDHLRRQRPDHLLLRRRVLACIRRDTRFKSWRVGRQLVCGYSAWPENGPVSSVNALADGHDLSGSDLATTVAMIFARANAPLYLKDIVTMVGRATPSPALQSLAWDELTLLTSPSAALERREILARVWAEITLLPHEQRVALLLNLRDDQGCGALAYLPFTGVASIPQIASVLEMSVNRLAGLWNDLPLPDAQIAKLLGIPQQRVINMRQAGRKRLRRRLAIREI